MKEQNNIKDNLSIISQAIKSTDQQFGSKILATSLIVWGLGVISSATIHFLLIGTAMAWVTWVITMPITLAVNLWILRSSKGSYKTITQRFSHIVWMSMAIALGWSAWMCIEHELSFSTFALFFSGLGALIMGWTYRSKSLVLGAICLMIASLALPYLTIMWQLIATIIAMSLGYLIPGIQLRNTDKNV